MEEDINLLIGINGSGKSNFFKAVEMLKSGMKNELSEVVREWGGFDSLFCKTVGSSEYADSIGLNFILDKKNLSEFNYYFQDDIEYQIILRKKPAFDNYDVVEWVNSVKENKSNFTLLNFQHGRGWIFEKEAQNDPNENGGNNGTGWQKIHYDDKNPEELVLASIDDSDRYPALTALAKALRSIDIYHYFDTSPNSPLRKSIKATGKEKLSARGENLFPLLNTLDIKHTPTFERITCHLNMVNEQFSDVKFQQLGNGVFQAYLKEKKLNSAIHAAHVSDGTLKFLCLMAIFLNPSRGPAIFIDEPEKGLHPDMINHLATIMSEASYESQIIIATHSTLLLNRFKVKNIRVFEKDESNLTQINAFSEEDFQDWYTEFAPGNMWEKGELGGVRF